MLCKDAEDLIRKYKAGSITADNFLLLITHTKECPNCKALFERAEASLGNVARKSFFSSLYNNFLEWADRKYSEGKVYTKKNMYIILTFLLGALTFLYLGMNKKVTFNEFFFFIGLFVFIISFFVFLIVYLLKE